MADGRAPFFFNSFLCNIYSLQKDKVCEWICLPSSKADDLSRFSFHLQQVEAISCFFFPPVFESEFLYGDYLITQAFQTDDVVTTL